MATFEEIEKQIKKSEEYMKSVQSDIIKDLMKVRGEIQNNIKIYTDSVKILKEEQKLHENTYEILKKIKDENKDLYLEYEKENHQIQERMRIIKDHMEKIALKGQDLTRSQSVELQYYAKILKELKEKKKILDFSSEIAKDESDSSEEQFQNYEKIFKLLKNIRDVHEEMVFSGSEFAKNLMGLPRVSLDFWNKLEGIGTTLQKLKIVTSSWLAGFASMVSTVNFIGKIYQTTKSLVLELDKQSALTTQLTGQNRLYNREIEKASTINRTLGISLSETAEMFRSLYENLSQFSMLTKSARMELVVLASGMQKFGVSGELTSNILQDLTKTLGNTEKEAMNIQKTMFFVARNLGLSVKTTMSEFSRSLEQLSVYGNKSIEIFKNLASVSKLTGIAVSELNAVFGQQLNTFEGSANMAGKLNSILGKDLLNSVDLLYQSEDERLKTVLKSLQADGRNIQNMSKYEKLTIATAIGFKDMNKFIRLTSVSLEELEVQQAKARLAQADQEKWNQTVEKATTFTERWKLMWQEFGIVLSPVLEILTMIVDIFTSMIRVLSEITAELDRQGGVWNGLMSTILQAVKIMIPLGVVFGVLAASAALFGISLGVILLKTLLITGAIVAAAKAFQLLYEHFHKKGSPEFWELPKHMAIHVDEYKNSIEKVTPKIDKFKDVSSDLHKVQTKKSSPALWEISKVMSENNSQLSVEIDKSNSKLEKHNEILRQTSNISKVQNVSTSSDIQRLEYAKNSNIPTTKNISIDVNFLDIEATNRSLKKAIMQIFEEELQ